MFCLVSEISQCCSHADNFYYSFSSSWVDKETIQSVGKQHCLQQSKDAFVLTALYLDSAVLDVEGVVVQVHLQQSKDTLILTALYLDSAVLDVEGVVVQVHHTGEGGCEPHAVGDGAVAVQPNHHVLLRHVVQVATGTKFTNLQTGFKIWSDKET